VAETEGTIAGAVEKVEKIEENLIKRERGDIIF